MISYSPTVPLSLDDKFGYSMNSTLKSVAVQNFKMLMLTAPGERIMLPDFGVGLRNFLFEQKSPALENSLRDRIDQQVSKYMPSVVIERVIFNDSESDRNRLNVVIFYSIPSIGLSSVLNV
jgi:uncharacterized protein